MSFDPIDPAKTLREQAQLSYLATRARYEREEEAAHKRRVFWMEGVVVMSCIGLLIYGIW